MSWITITETDLKTRIDPSELAAYRAAATDGGQADPVTGLIASVTDLVRGYAGVRYALGAGNTIPERLLDTTLSIIRYRIITRIPGLVVDEHRTKEYDDAIKLLERVAKGDFALEEPETADTETTGGATPSIFVRRRKFSRNDEAGL